MPATVTLTYVGAIDEIVIPDAGVTVKRGDTFTVGADLGGRLLEQVDVFQPTEKAAKSASTDPVKE